jgi:hypothetical protein
MGLGKKVAAIHRLRARRRSLGERPHPAKEGAK